MFSIRLFVAGAMVGLLTGCAIPAVNDAIMGRPDEPLVASASTPNPYGITGALNTRDAEALYASLETMVGGLSQKDQLAFMEAFFRVSMVDRCDETGEWGTIRNSFGGGRNSLGSCITTAKSAQFFAERARAYVADKRLDSSYAYTASNAFGAWTGGRSQRESYVNFIELYGDVMDDRDANYIHWRNSMIMHRKAESQRGTY